MAGFFQPVNGGNVGVIERRDNAGFLLESGQPVGVPRDVRGQHLDGDGRGPACVARAVDLTHSTGAERREDFVGTQTSSCGKGHGYWNNSTL